MPPPVVPWMSRVDHLILELLDEQGIALPPTAVMLALRERDAINAPSKSHVARRLRDELSYHGLVDQPHEGEVQGYYAITDLGQRYLHDADADPAEFVVGIDDDFDASSQNE